MLKGFFYRRATEDSASGTDVSIRFEINSKESILAKTTNLSSEGIQFILPRGKIILVPDERILLILNHPEHGEFKIQSEVYYFCNTTDNENNLVVCYGVKFIELSPATWDMVQDYCGTHLPEVTFISTSVSFLTQSAAVKSAPFPVSDKTPERSKQSTSKPVFTPEETVFTPIAPVKIAVPPIPGIIAEPAPIFTVEPPVATQPAAETVKSVKSPKPTEQPVKQPAAITEIPDTPQTVVEPLTPPVKPQEIPTAGLKKKSAVDNPKKTVAATPIPPKQPETPAPNSIQALAASLAAPPLSSTPAKAQSLSQEMIDRLIEKLQAEAQEESTQTPAQIYDSLPKPPQPVNPVLDQLKVTEHELKAVKKDFNTNLKSEAPIGIEYLKSVQSITPQHQEEKSDEKYLISNDPFAKKTTAGSEKTEPFTKLPQDNQSADPDPAMSSPALPPAASQLDTVSGSEKTMATPPLMTGASLVDLIMDMDATIQKASSQSPDTQKEPAEFKKNPIPTISFEELSNLNSQPVSNVKPEPPAPKEKPVTKPVEVAPVIPPIAPAASGISMDQKAIDKLVQTLLQEQSESETATVAENIKPVSPGGSLPNISPEKKGAEPKTDPYLQSTFLSNQPVTEKPAVKPQAVETKPTPTPASTPWPASPQPVNSSGLNILIPDPNNTRVMDQKSIDIIVQTLTQANNQPNQAPATNPGAGVPPIANAAFNQTPVKPFIPVESKRTLDQKAIDQVVQALTQNHAAKSSLNQGTVSQDTKTSYKEFGSTASLRAVDPLSNKENKSALSLTTLSATLRLENGTVLQCMIEQVYVGGLMVHVDQELPLNSTLKINIVGEGIRITDIQGTCTNCEPSRAGRNGFLAELFFKNLSNVHMEQFRTLIAKLDTK